MGNKNSTYNYNNFAWDGFYNNGPKNPVANRLYKSGIIKPKVFPILYRTCPKYTEKLKFLYEEGYGVLRKKIPGSNNTYHYSITANFSDLCSTSLGIKLVVYCNENIKIMLEQLLAREKYFSIFGKASDEDEESYQKMAGQLN